MDSLRHSDQQHHFQTYRRMPVTLSHGRGALLWDTEGREYIDLLAGIAVNALGHAHPALVKAVAQQAEKLIHVSNIYTTEPQVRLSEELVRLSGLDRVFLCNSGVEAVEGAFKTARKYAIGRGRHGPILSMEGCFHGRSLAAIAAGKKQYQQGFEPMPAGFRQIPFNRSESASEHIDHQTTAVIVEPVQGEGGVRPADPAFLQHLRRICDQTGTLLIFDEIQCGIGRTGTLFAFEQYGVKPDMLLLAKGLGGGFPVGAFLAKENVAAALKPGDHGSTFGGNPLAASAALTVLAVIREENLAESAREKGTWLMDELGTRLKGRSVVRDIRGLGLMIGVELDREAGPLVRKMAGLGVLANAASGNVLRLVPPLVITREQLEKAIDIIVRVIEEEENLS